MRVCLTRTKESDVLDSPASLHTLCCHACLCAVAMSIKCLALVLRFACCWSPQDTNAAVKPPSITHLGLDLELAMIKFRFKLLMHMY